jgi:hemerythrin-like metal-binding protein
MRPTIRNGYLAESICQVLFRFTTKAREGHFPEFIYGALPSVYVCAGLLTMAVLRNWAAAFSGLAWISAAGIVWVLRYRYRSAFNHSAGRMDVPEAAREAARGRVLTEVVWRPSFECGHSVIDAQHRRLFGLGNELIEAVSTNKARGDIEWLLDELVDHITDHFCTEEAVLAKTKHPITEEHQEIHRNLLSKAADIRDRAVRGELPTTDLVGFIVYDVITDHITTEDLKFSRVASVATRRGEQTLVSVNVANRSELTAYASKHA